VLVPFLLHNNSVLHLAYKSLLDFVENERKAKVEEALRVVSQQRADAERSRREQEKKKQLFREEEIKRQAPLHSSHSPVHPCPLANSARLTYHGRPRNGLCNYVDEYSYGCRGKVVDFQILVIF